MPGLEAMLCCALQGGRHGWIKKTERETPGVGGGASGLCDVTRRPFLRHSEKVQSTREGTAGRSPRRCEELSLSERWLLPDGGGAFKKKEMRKSAPEVAGGEKGRERV